MNKIILISNDETLINSFKNTLREEDFHLEILNNTLDFEKNILKIDPDLAFLDIDFEESKILYSNLKLYSKSQDMQVILITDGIKNFPNSSEKIDGYLVKPFTDNILLSNIKTYLRIKKRLDMIFSKTSELAKSLYQLNVMYDSTSQLAGTLDKTKLIEILKEGFERSISFSMCVVLLVSNNDIQIIISSLHPISERLEMAIKMRMMLIYRHLFINKKVPVEFSIDDIKVSKSSKHFDKTFDIKIVDYNTLFSTINTTDNFFGLVEVFREEEFSQEDRTCFQTLVKQVSLPFESASLYEELQETNKKLEKLEQLKSEFISIVSHELRTPLTAIKNSLKIILTGKAGEISGAMSNFLNMASRNVNRLSGIINDLLDLSKIEAGKMEYRFSNFNIKRLFDDIYNTFCLTTQEKGLYLNLELEESIPDCAGDSDKITQILSNLVANAIKFTEKGGITLIAQKSTPLEIKKCPKAISQDYITIQVKDTGIGIEEEDKQKVFDKFQQIESALVRKVGGTGLGLSIAKELVEAHKGCIWLDSIPSIGSEFSFILPIATPQNSVALALEQTIQKARQNNETVGIIYLEEIDNLKLLEKIQDNQQIVNKYENMKIFIQNNVSPSKIWIILPNSNKMALDILMQKLLELLKNNSLEYNILAGMASYPENGINSKELLEKIEENLVNL